MPFHKVIYNGAHRFATVHSFGCTFRCPVCSYRLRSGPDGTPGQVFPKPDQHLSPCQIRKALASVPIERVNFMGGEPTVAVGLEELLAFAKNELHARTYLGHTNGGKLPLANLDGANVGFKAWNPDVHLTYTGRPKKPIFDNFAAAFTAGLELKANIVFVPGLVDLDQVQSVAAWLARLSREIPFHIMGYIPVPGQPYARPTEEQMTRAVKVCRKHLTQVDSSHLTGEQALNLTCRDDRFAVRQIA